MLEKRFQESFTMPSLFCFTSVAEHCIGAINEEYIVWVQELRDICLNNSCWLCLLLLMKLKAMRYSTIGDHRLEDLQVSMAQSLFFSLFSQTNKTTISNIFLGSFISSNMKANLIPFIRFDSFSRPSERWIWSFLSE